MRNDFERDVFKALAKEYGKNNVVYEAESFPYQLSYTYTPDFKVRDGASTFYIEAKGYFRPENRRTLLAVREQTDIDLRICFQRNSKLYKNGKDRYTDWADRYGFSSCVGCKTLTDLL